jgi:hypothetical protein
MKAQLGPLSVAEGGHLLIKRALAQVAVGEQVTVVGSAPALELELRAWCRAQGHPVGADLTVTRGTAEAGRWRLAERAGSAGAPVERPPASWGVAPRGSKVEPGGPEFSFSIDRRQVVWADEVARLYAQAAAAQWDPAKAIVWDQRVELPAEIEDAVVQVMTYLIENETAALVVPAGFLTELHPHFREVAQLLAVQVADEARHIEVFTRRALLNRSELGLSTVGGRTSLKTLIDEPDFSLAALLLSVLGEGSFLSLLGFLRDHAPDPITRDVARLAAQDEARHVAFGLGHLTRHAQLEPGLLDRLASAIERRHDALANTSGLNEEVFDALILIAAGSWEPRDLARGFKAVQRLQHEMDEGRRKRLERIGFSPERAAQLSSLHTRNFM